MKKLLILIFILCFAFTAYAADIFSRSSGLQTGSAVIHSGRGLLTGVLIEVPVGYVSASLVIYDNTKGTGTEIFRDTIWMTSPSQVVYKPLPHPVRVFNGIYATKESSAIRYIIHYYGANF